MICPFAEQKKQTLLKPKDLEARRETLDTLLMIDAAGHSNSEGLQSAKANQPTAPISTQSG